MAYFNGKKVFFNPKIVVTTGSGGADKEELIAAINEKTETISNYVPVLLTDVSYAVTWLHDAVTVTEDMVKNGLYMMRIAEGANEYSNYLISGEDVDHLYTEKSMGVPQMGEVGDNLINSHSLSVGYIIAKEQSLATDGCIFVTRSSVECVTKENIDEILGTGAVG